MSHTSQEDITYEIDIISRKNLPKDLYLTQFKNDKDWSCIHLYTFSNGLQYVIGSNDYYENVKDALKYLKFEYGTFKDVSSAKQLHQYFTKELMATISYQDVSKIYSYYKNHTAKIKEVLDFYSV